LLLNQPHHHHHHHHHHLSSGAGTIGQTYALRHWVPFSSPSTVSRATVEVF
jgi:hypothetical protein